MAKKLFSKIGDAVQSGLSAADDMLDEATGKVKDALADADTAYTSQSFSNMDEVAIMLNALTEADTYKSFKVLAAAQNKADGVDVLLHVVKK